MACPSWHRRLIPAFFICGLVLVLITAPPPRATKAQTTTGAPPFVFVVRGGAGYFGAGLFNFGGSTFNAGCTETSKQFNDQYFLSSVASSVNGSTAKIQATTDSPPLLVTTTNSVFSLTVYARGPAGTPTHLVRTWTGLASVNATGDEQTVASAVASGPKEITAEVRGSGSQTVSNTDIATIDKSTGSTNITCFGTTYTQVDSFDYNVAAFSGSNAPNQQAQAIASVTTTVTGYLVRPNQQPPVANISGPTSVSVSQNAHFDGSSSHDPDGNIIDYKWTMQDASGQVVSSGPTIDHLWNTPGTYQVSLTVTDNDGQIGTANKTVVVALCTAPTIITQPSNQTISAGQAATLNVAADGTSPITYQWFEGERGDTLRLVGTNSPSFTTPSLNMSTKYWVRISNSCGQVDSNTATITICGPKVSDLTDIVMPPSPNVSVADADRSERMLRFSVRNSCTNELIRNSHVDIDYTPQPNTGGHQHHDSGRPITDPMVTLELSADSSTGEFEIPYVAPRISGRIDVNIRCSTAGNGPCVPGAFTIFVEVSGLEPLPVSNRYNLVGNDPNTHAGQIHPHNHHGTPALNQALINLADKYIAAYGGDKLSFNDMSLLLGGVFDIGENWGRPHAEHDLGLNADLRIVDIDPRRRGALVQMAWDSNLGVLVENAHPHWHLTIGRRGFCKILGGRYCSPENPPHSSGDLIAVSRTSNGAATSEVTLHVTSYVTFDQQTRLYTYSYSFRNDTNSSLEVSSIQIPLGSVAVSNLRAPQGWAANLWREPTTVVAFAATDIGILPPNYVDDGNLIPSPYQIKQGQTLSGYSFQSPYPPSTVDLVAQGFKSLPIFSSDDETQQASNFDGSYVGTTTGPVLGGPILISEETSTRAIALDSVVHLREPFQFDSPVPWGADRRTRVMLFATNFDLLPGENTSVVTADAEDVSHNIYPLTVEYVGKVPGYDWLNCVVVRLSDDMNDIGDVLVRLTVRGVSSNRVRLGVGHTGGGPPNDQGAVPTPGRRP